MALKTYAEKEDFGATRKVRGSLATDIFLQEPPIEKRQVGDLWLDPDEEAAIPNLANYATLDNLSAYLTTSAWNAAGGSAGRTLDYRETQQQEQTALDNVAVVIVGLYVTFTVTDRPVMVECHQPWLTSSSAAMTITIALMDENSNLTQFASTHVPDSAQVASATVMERFTTPGTYFRRGVFQRTTGTGRARTGAGLATVKNRIRAYEM